MGAEIIGFRDEDLGGSAQIAVVQQRDIYKILRGMDAMFFQHHGQQIGIVDQAGIKQFPAQGLTGLC